MTNNKALKLQFAADCKIIEMNREYPDYTGTERFGIITALSEEQLVGKYDSLLGAYKPYIVLDSGFDEVRDDFRRNEKKHEMRSYRGHIFGIDGDFDIHHPECAVQDCIEQVLAHETELELWAKVKLLPPIQQRRLIMHFAYGMSSRAIAKEEGVNYSAVDKSLKSAISKLKELFD